MLKKLLTMAAVAAMLGTLGYAAMGITMVAKSDTATVLTFAASERVPLLPRTLAVWRVQLWDGCPAMERDVGALGQTLRGYGLDGFDRQRVLATASRLIELGCDVNQRSLTGHTPLHEAILYNEPDVVRFLLANGADTTVAIKIPDASNSQTLRLFSGLDSLRFAEELQLKSRHAEGRDEILQLLKGHRAS